MRHLIAGRYWRRLQLLRFEALVMAHVGTPSLMQVADERAHRFVHLDTEPAEDKGAARVVGSELLERLPRCEAHLSRELDRALTVPGAAAAAGSGNRGYVTVSWLSEPHVRCIRSAGPGTAQRDAGRVSPRAGGRGGSAGRVCPA